jgi:protein-L-isoaspartate(D-aspartate) O-methyltransferase
LAELAAARLARNGYRNVQVRHGDGTLGWTDAAPFDAILVSAGSPDVPAPLRAQLKVGGKLVIPVGEQSGQALLRVTRTETGFEERELCSVRFVPLVGHLGWPPEATDEPPLRSPIASSKP